MSDWSYRSSPSLRSRMLRSSNASAKALHAARVDRVLAVLNDDRLLAEAASVDRSERSVLIDCPDAAHVWTDHRVAARIKQLQETGVTVERIQRKIVTVYGEMERHALKVGF